MNTLDVDKIRSLSDSGYFDQAWYLARYPDVRELNMGPAEHFLRIGVDLGRDLSATFSNAQYRETVGYGRQDVAATRESGSESSSQAGDRLDDGLELKLFEKCDARHFMSEAYLNRYPDVAAAGVEPYSHFVASGFPEGRAGLFFDNDWYLSQYDDVRVAGMDGFDHYRKSGKAENRNSRFLEIRCFSDEAARDGDVSDRHRREANLAGRELRNVGAGISAGAAATPASAAPSSSRLAEDLAIEADLIRNSPLFDAQWYAEHYPEAVVDGHDPFTHFLEHGVHGNDPSPYFSSAWYLEQSDDVRTAGINPLGHYLRFGHSEARSPHPVFDVDWYRRHYLNGSSEIEPVGHYLAVGHLQAPQPHALFDCADYLDRYPDLRGAGVDPYLHWLKHGRAEGRQGRDPATLGDSLKVAVVAHIFYEDLWPQISMRLRAIPVPFDLIVTVSPGSELADAVHADWPAADVIEMPNSGRDIGPFLRVLPLLLDRRYDVVCKVHTKRGATEPDTWRHMLLEGVLGSAGQVRQILGWFKHDPDLATVGPNALYLDGPRFVGPNAKALEDLFATVEGPGVAMPGHWGFFAGSMFWIRPELLRGLVDADLLHLIEDDNRSHDGQIAHAIERMFGLIAARNGRRIGLTDVSGPRGGTTVDVRRAPNRMVWDDLGETLPLRTRELARRIPSLRRSKRRTWLAPPGTKLGITFVGPVEAVNGLGVSARGFVDAAIATGIPVHVIKWRPGFDRVRMQEVDVPTPGEQVINIVHLNLDLIHSAGLLDMIPLDALISPAHYNIVIVSWELLAVNPEWVETIHRFDEIWASSTYMVRAMEAVSAIPARVVRPALNVTSRDAVVRLPFDLPQDRTIFFYGADFGSIVKRKNPEAFWRAYVAEFKPSDGAFCVIKLHYGDPTHPLLLEITALAASRPDIMLLTESLSDDEMASLFARIDCYVSTHRAEGLGLTLLEAMLAGKPVIATGHSGESDFVRQDTALTVDYDLVEVGEGAEPYMASAVWAEPRHDSLRARMRQVLEDRDAARVIGARGRERAIELFSVEQASARLGTELTRIWRSGGGSPQDGIITSR